MGRFRLTAAVTGVATVATLVAGPLASTATAAAHPGRADARPGAGGPGRGAHAYRHGVVPTRGTVVGASVSLVNDMTFHAGTAGIGVTTGKPRVYVVYWGSQWGTQYYNSTTHLYSYGGDHYGLAPDQQRFFRGVGTGGETWSGVMTQYCQGISTGLTSCPSWLPHVGYPTGGALAGVWEDTAARAPYAASALQLANEANRAAAHFGHTTATANRNVQYVITSPTGTHPDGFGLSGANFCAWHDHTADPVIGSKSPYGDVAFTNMPYLLNLGAACGENFVNAGTAGTLDGVTIVGGHEYAETLTDQSPDPDFYGNLLTGGWADLSSNENGDKCAWIRPGVRGGAADLTLTTGRFAVQATWSNDANYGAGGCELAHPVVTTTVAKITLTNPGPQTTPVGTAVGLQLTGTDSLGRTLTYTASGLPTGLTISSAGLVTGAPTVPAATTVLVTARDGTGAVASMQFGWTVTGTVACTGGQLLGNPGFETGSAAPWTTTSGVVSASSTSEAAHTGTYFAWLGGYMTAHTDTLAQTVTIPAGCTSASFSLWLHIDSTDLTNAAYDTMSVRVLNGAGTLLATLASYSNLDGASGYRQVSFDLAGYIGQQVVLQLVGVDSGTGFGTTNFTVDDALLSVA